MAVNVPVAAPTPSSPALIAGGPAPIGADMGGVVQALQGLVTSLQGLVNALAPLVQAQAQAQAVQGGGSPLQVGQGPALDPTQSSPVQGAPTAPPVPAVPSDPAPQPATSASPDNQSKRDEILRIAAGEVGLKEEGGEDKGARIDEYRKSAGGSGGPWCAYFASWVFNKAGAPLVDTNGDGWTVTIANWGKSKGTWHDKGWTPKPGDLMFFKNSGGNPNFVNHIEIVEKVAPDGTIHTIGGNSSDQVKRNTFKPDAGNIVGFVEAPV